MSTTVALSHTHDPLTAVLILSPVIFVLLLKSWYYSGLYP